MIKSDGRGFKLGIKKLRSSVRPHSNLESLLNQLSLGELVKKKMGTFA